MAARSELLSHPYFTSTLAFSLGRKTGQHNPETPARIFYVSVSRSDIEKRFGHLATRIAIGDFDSANG